MLPINPRFIFISCIAMSSIQMSWSSALLGYDIVMSPFYFSKWTAAPTLTSCNDMETDRPQSNIFTSREPSTDTTKISKRNILFGRSRLKTHFELHGKTNEVNIKKRDQWISETLNLMNTADSGANAEVLSMQELIHEDFYQMSFRLINNGKIIFQDGSFLHLVSTSAHASKDIGDVTLAVNEDGDVYINQGHICAGIIHFKSHKKDAAPTAGDFLKNFKSDTDDESWLLYKVANKNKTNKQKF